MADFDPFSLNQDQKDDEMPVFASFDTKDSSKDDHNDLKDQKDMKKEKDSEFPSFESFAPFDSAPSNTFDNSGFPKFDSFDTNQKNAKDNDQMPTFDSFSTPTSNAISNSNSQSKPPTFDSDSDEDYLNYVKNANEEPLYASLSKTFQTISNMPQEEDNHEQKEQNEITEEQQNALNFPSFGSFPTFESNNDNNANADSSITKSAVQQNNSLAYSNDKSKLEPQPKVQQQEGKLSMTASLSSVKNLLKQINGQQHTLNFNPEHSKISIPPPKPFKETVLAKELSEYCMKVFNHEYVFTD